MSHHGESPFNLAWSNMTEEERNEMFKMTPALINEATALKTPSPGLSHHLNQINEELGATKNFPDGKISETDSGEIKFACAVFENNLIMSFGKRPISWIGFTKEEAKNLAEYILKRIEEIK